MFTWDRPGVRVRKLLAAAAVTNAAVLATAGGASASAGAAGAGHAAPVAGWRVVKTVRAASMPQFQSMAVTSAASAWAFAQTSGAPAAWRLQDGAWRRAPFPGRVGGQVLAAGASGADNVWAFESLPQGSGRALRWDGSRWTAARQFTKVIMGGLVLGPRDVWVFGSPYVPGNGLGAWHYNGSSWTRSPAAGELTTASGLSPSSIWAAGGKTAAHTLISTYGEPFQVVPDGSGGLWIPVITGYPGTFTLLHRSAGGSLHPARLPEPGSSFRMSVARVPGSAVAFGAGALRNTDGVPAEGLILRYGR